MRFMLTLIGLLTIIGGLLPFLADKGWLPTFLSNIPTSGPSYQFIIIALGVIAFITGLKMKNHYKRT